MHSLLCVSSCNLLVVQLLFLLFRVEYHLAHSQSHTVILKVFSVSGTVVGEGRVRNELVRILQ